MPAIEQHYAQHCDTLASQGIGRQLPAVNQTGLLDFSHNDYLGLSQHPDVVYAARQYSQLYGAGATGSRLLSGNSNHIAALETLIAQSKGTQAALVFNSGYQANATVLSALLNAHVLGSTPLVFSDRLNHASLHHACKLKGIRQIRYRHNDLNHLADCLEKYSSSTQAKFIVTETVFGMDGDCLNIEQLKQIAQAHNAFVYLDEAHATGLFGEQGYGLASGFTQGVVMGTFSKAIGGSGAYIACSDVVQRYIINKCTGFIYSTAPNPAAIGAASAAWQLVPQLNQQRAHLHRLATTLRHALQRMGFDTGQSTTHIVPIVLGCESKTLSLKQHLLTHNILSSAIRPPTVPPNTARVRIALATTHTEQDIERLIMALESWQTTPWPPALARIAQSPTA